MDPRASLSALEKRKIFAPAAAGNCVCVLPTTLSVHSEWKLLHIMEPGH